MDIKRRHVLSFSWVLVKQLTKLVMKAIFTPEKSEKISKPFFEIYSNLWDLAEHSISHQGFHLPSALGGGSVSLVNKQLSQLYGMTYACLSFGGSSGALLTLLTAVLPKLQTHRDIILFDDICHQSAIGGLIFGRWKAVRISRIFHPKHHTAHPLSLATIKTTVEKHGADRIAAILLVLPSYDGFRSPSEDKKIYDYAKSQGICVVVDGAWDALRFRQNSQGSNTLSSICDVWVSSPHKRGLTPSSLGCILTNDETIAHLWDEALDLGFRSSSVSFVEIMIAEHRLSQVLSGEWEQGFEHAERAADILRSRVKDINSDLYCVEPSNLDAEQGDITHILISTERIANLDARDWANTLSTRFALDVEKATASTLLLLCGSPGHLEQIELIISTLKQALILTHQQSRDLKHGL